MACFSPWGRAGVSPSGLPDSTEGGVEVCQQSGKSSKYRNSTQPGEGLSNSGDEPVNSCIPHFTAVAGKP